MFRPVKLSEKVLDLNDLSGAVSSLSGKDEKEERKDEGEEEGAKNKKVEADKRCVGHSCY